jgi:hypothetical protein
MDELQKDPSIQEIAEKGDAVYARIKADYEPAKNGKFLAIEVETGNSYIADTSKEAVDQARAVHPGKLFYVVKIGFNSVETLAHSLVGRS